MRKKDKDMNKRINKLFDLTGKVAIVTGGAGWLGTAISQALAEAGATVAIIDCNAVALNKLVAGFNKDNLKAIGIVADCFEDKLLRDSFDKIVSDCGRLDILVNCAYSGPVPEVDKAAFEDYDKALHNGPAAYGIAAQQAAKCMRKSGGGVIINIGSIYAMVTGYPEVYENITSPNSIVYQAGKAAIIQMTRHMAVYWAKDNIRVNCISPGTFPSDLTQKQIPELVRRLESKVPMGRIGRPWELKGTVVFLASDASSYVTGQNIVVDGGWTAW